MHKKLRTPTICIAAACIIAGNLLLAGCLPGQLFGPTPTFTPTITLTPTGTLTPTPKPTATPDPIQAALDEAMHLFDIGDHQEAISKYQNLLQ